MKRWQKIGSFLCLLVWCTVAAAGCGILRADVKFGIENGSPVVGIELGLDRDQASEPEVIQPVAPDYDSTGK